MSCLNLMLRPDGGYLFSDGAVWGPDGVVTALQSKLFPIADLGAVVALRGTTITDRSFLESALSECADLDDLLEALPLLAAALTRFAVGINRFTAAGHHADHLFVELTAVAWLRTEARPAAWAVTTADPNGPNYGGGPVRTGSDSGPGILVETPRFYCTPNFDPGCLQKPLATEQDFRDLDPVVDGLDIVEAQRSTPVDIPGIGPLHIVGGFAEMATLRAGGVDVATLRIWPDVIGSRIDPERKIGADSPWSPGGSRRSTDGARRGDRQ